MAQPSATSTLDAERGLKLALGAFLALLVAALLPVALLVAFVLTVAVLVLLHRDARARGSGLGQRMTLLAAGLLVASLLATIAHGTLAQRALANGDFRGWVQLGWLYAAGTIALGAAFYFAPLHLAGDRARLLLGLALGVAAAVAIASVLNAGPAGEAFVAKGQNVTAASAPGTAAYNDAVAQMQQDYATATESLVVVQSMPYIVFAWGYSTTLGALIRQRAQPLA